MNSELAIQRTERADQDATLDLYGRAFPEEELRPLVQDLLQLPEDDVFSLTAVKGGKIIGHIAFTICGLAEDEDARTALLGPLAIDPDYQRQGIGRALQQAGFDRLVELDIRTVCVLGDPAYYGRLGFKAELGIKPPYPIPEEWASAWQSLNLTGGERCSLPGTLTVPEPWQNPALWGR